MIIIIFKKGFFKLFSSMVERGRLFQSFHLDTLKKLSTARGGGSY